MSVSRLKRPSSARRNIKHETFSPFVSATRLRRVQSLLGSTNKSDNGQPDSILCISGIDSRYNDGMLELINYLLFGFFELRKAELERSGFDEEVIDDVLFLIQRDRVDVYCNPINYHYLLPYVSHWRNVFFHCLSEEEYDDEEKAEDFKIYTFVSIVKDCQRIGIPYSSSDKEEKAEDFKIHTFVSKVKDCQRIGIPYSSSDDFEKAEDFKIHTFVSIVKDCQRIGIPYSSSVKPQVFEKMAIEKWPIIQVYGVEGVGGGGFFTMVHEVVDISKDLKYIYDQMDPVALETIIIEHISKLEHQWDTMLSIVEYLLSNNTQLTEDKIFEPLKSYYLHGCASNVHEKSRQIPFVLFGQNSCKKNLQAVCEKNLPTLNSASSVSRLGANFMVCRAVSPRGPVSCTRTYFFTRDFINPFQDAKVTAYEQNMDLRYLVTIYTGMIDGVIAGIQTYCNTLSIRQATEVAIETLHESCVEIKNERLQTFLKASTSLEFKIETVDSHGRHSNLRENESSQLVKCVTFNVYDIPSIVEQGKTLGSLLFSEMFLDSSIQIKSEDGSTRTSGTFLLLTDHIPRYQMWAYTNPIADRQMLETKLEGDTLSDDFGKLLLSGDPVSVGCSSTLCMPPEEASLYAYENGIVILNQNYGAVVLHGNHIKSALFYDGDTTNTVAVLVVEYQPNFVPFMPFHLVDESCQLILLFTPKSKAYKHLYTEVLHIWREEKDSTSPKVQRIDSLPDGCHLMHTLLQHRYFTTAKSTMPKTALQKAAISLPHLYSFLNHYTVSSAGRYPVPEKDLNSILHLPREPDDEQDIEVVVTLISGIPGSYQEKLCDVLSSLSKDQNRYVVLKPAIESSQTFTAQDIQAKLKATLNVHRRRKQGQLIKNTRVLYVIPGYTDILSVVQAVECHPDPDVRQHCAIGSVTVCVDPLNTFIENKYTFPQLLNVCAQGWVNQIVMTSSTSIQNEALEEIQHLLRSVNSDVAFLLADKGQVSRSMDLDAILSEETFREESKIRARHLLCPGWSAGQYKQTDSQMTTVQLRFTLPLDKQKLVNKLNGLKSRLKPFPFEDNIYNVHGKVRFVGSNSDDPMELHYTTLSGMLEILPVSETAKEKAQKPGNYMTFMGCGLTQTKLKEWLRECAPKKPEKKTLVTRKDLTREEINKLHKEHHLDTLPDGWFYNGTQYVSFDGTKQDKHPDLESFVEDYIRKKNTVIEQFNSQVEELSNSYKDLFS